VGFELRLSGAEIGIEMTATKRRPFFQVLALGVFWLAFAGIAWVLGADSKWVLIAVLIALASFVNLVRVALLPESVPRQKTPSPVVKRKQWILVAAYFGVMICWTGGLFLLAGLLGGLTPNERLAVIIAYVSVMGIVSMVVIWGIAAKLGLSRFKPKPWVRRLFNIPDDYQPPTAN
jgi:hypothetical protein